MNELQIIIGLLMVVVIMALVIIWQQSGTSHSQTRLEGRGDEQSALFRQLRDEQVGLREAQLKELGDMQLKLQQKFGDLQHGVEKRLGEVARDQGERMEKSSDKLRSLLYEQLKDISGQVEKRLSSGFEKTNETFTDVVKRLALIDEAQKKITELSGNVVSLQEILADKRSRGAFGEAQLAALVRNTMPESSYKLQFVLSNSTRVDCMLFLPDPTGNVPIDAKFTLESYKIMLDDSLPTSERQLAERQFKQDVKKHIHDIAEKYIIPGETAEGAMMFVPAEAVFAEIHAHHSDLVEESQRLRVWMTSPTTLMAVLTTALAVLKDSATRKQIHVIRDHLNKLSEDFMRFQKRMDALSKHIQQANQDVDEVNTSARKITSRFEKIEKVEIEEETERNSSQPAAELNEESGTILSSQEEA